jgi:hypothetical protein
MDKTIREKVEKMGFNKLLTNTKIAILYLLPLYMRLPNSKQKIKLYTILENSNVQHLSLKFE